MYNFCSLGIDVRTYYTDILQASRYNNDNKKARYNESLGVYVASESFVRVSGLPMETFSRHTMLEIAMIRTVGHFCQNRMYKCRWSCPEIVMVNNLDERLGKSNVQ